MTPEQIYSLIIIGIFTAALCYCFTLYHKAHGRDVDAVQAGGNLVMEALRRDGRLMSSQSDEDADLVAFNYTDGTEAEKELEENAEYNAVMDRLAAANTKLQEQQTVNHMETMNAKV